MGTTLLFPKHKRYEDLKQWIQIYNRTTDKYILTEIVHFVYDLGYDEIAEEMASSIYGEADVLKYLLDCDYEVSEKNNYKKPSTSFFRKIKSLWK